MFQNKNNWANVFVKASSLGMVFYLTSTAAMAQTNPVAQTDGSMVETGKPVAHAGQRAVNNLPNPYETQRFFGTLPDGRRWGSVSAVDIDVDGVHVWAGDRCGNNQCATTPDINPIVKLDSTGRVVNQLGAGQMIWPHGIDVDHEGNVWTVSYTHLTLPTIYSV